MLKNPQDYFADLADPRRATCNKLRRLEDIVMITLCAVAPKAARERPPIKAL